MKKSLLGIVFLLLFSLAPSLWAGENQVASPLQGYVDSGAMPGFVTVMATSDNIIAVDCVGWSNIEEKKPMDAKTFFWVASMTKALVGCSAAILADEGKLNLDAPVTDYLPELAEIQVYRHEEKEELENSGVGHIVTAEKPKTLPTLRQCLSHTAGWRFVSPFQKRFGIDWIDHQRAILTYAVMGLDFEPGERFNYSNIGINIAAAAIERVTKKSLEDFLQERFFGPLQMTETTFYPTKDQIARMATPYKYDTENKKLVPLDRIPFTTQPLDDRTKRFAEGGGGLFSTAPDFVKFYQMLAGHGTFQGKQVMSEKAVEMATTKQTREGIDVNYGFGINITEQGFGHGGAAGTDGAVFKNGLVTLYMVQVENIPDQGKILRSFLETANKVYESQK